MPDLSRRLFTSSLLAAGFAAPALAQEPSPQEASAAPPPVLIYDDRLGSGWQNWSWAKTTLSVDIGSDVKPISVEGQAWEALFLGRTSPLSTKGYTYLRFGANGGKTGGQHIALKAMVDQKPIDPGFDFRLKANEWDMFEVPLSQLGAQDKQVGGFWWQAMFNPMDTWYITLIDLV